jgi:hypothetical protein
MRTGCTLPLTRAALAAHRYASQNLPRIPVRAAAPRAQEITAR